MDNARNRVVGGGLFHANLEHSINVDGASEYIIACRLRKRYGLACDGRLVKAGRALDNHAIGGHPVPGAHEHMVVHVQRGREDLALPTLWRSEEHTSELQSLMRISYAVFCLKHKKNHDAITTPLQTP